jgi:hypothetical protein
MALPDVSTGCRSFLVWRQEGQQAGTLVSPLAWKYDCSTMLKMNDAPQSVHLMDLFVNIILDDLL